MTGSSSSVDPTRPRIRNDISVYPLDDELVVYDHQTGETFVLNATGKLVWEGCTGDRTIEQIAGAVAVQHGIAIEQALSDVRDLLDSLRQAGLLEA